MKTILLFLCAALLLFAGCTGEQRKTTDPIATAAADAEAPEDVVIQVVPAEDLGVPLSPDEYVGFYADEGGDLVSLEKTPDGYAMSVVLYGIIGRDEGTVSASEDGVVFRTADLDGNPLTLLLYSDGDGCALRVEESTWEPLPVGTVVSGLVPSSPEERGDLIVPDDAERKESHYTFQPKICSVFMEEVFGKDMCDAWYNLVDAVLAGEDTFACKDQYTYDWMMGQFPEHCLPILKELIDYAWDRENSVVDGVATFTYLVPPEEAKARIEEFGEQIEGMLNEVFEDGDSDFEKCLALYIYFSDHYTYDWDTYEKMDDEYVDYTSCARFFRTGIGICHEISSAYSYLLLQAGVQATTMSGNRSYDHAGHQWSYVRINGKEYHIDPTYVLGTGGALRYFLMTDEKREEEDSYEQATFFAVSHYAQDHPHPDYVADDDTFRPLWDHEFEALDRTTHTVVCPGEENENGEWTNFRFDYSGY